jgi:hypothetical protein
MILKCVENNPKMLDPKHLQVDARYLSVYPLTIGSEYSILGMMLLRSFLYLLVEDDQRSPPDGARRDVLGGAG